MNMFLYMIMVEYACTYYICVHISLYLWKYWQEIKLVSGSDFREFLGKIGKVFWSNIFYTCSSISVEAAYKIS